MRRLAAVFLACVGCADSSRPPSPLPTPPAIVPSDPLVGTYALTFNVGAECPIPDEARTRRYAATIDATGGGAYVVTLGDATFLGGLFCESVSGMGCHQFRAGLQGSVVSFTLATTDDTLGGEIVEHLPSGTWLRVSGTAIGQLSSGTIEARGGGSIWYCPSPAASLSLCPSAATCRTNDIRLSFTRNPSPWDY